MSAAGDPNAPTYNPNAPSGGSFSNDDEFKPGTSFTKQNDNYLSMDLNIEKAERYYKQINNNAPPAGSGVMAAQSMDIWQERLESFEWGDTIPRRIVESDMTTHGTAQSLKISDLTHAVIADGKDPNRKRNGGGNFARSRYSKNVGQNWYFDVV